VAATGCGRGSSRGVIRRKDQKETWNLKTLTAHGPATRCYCITGPQTHAWIPHMHVQLAAACRLRAAKGTTQGM
jgi:hypothetical protein